MYRGVRRNVCLQNNVRLQRWMTHIFRLHYMWTHHFSNMFAIWIFPQGARHVIKMQIHVRHTNMVSLNRFWNMLYLTFHGFESLNSREIRLTPSSYEFLWFIIHRDASAEILKWFDGVMKVAFSACPSLVVPTVFTVIRWNEF